MISAYFDCSSGISGDMCLAALVDAGVPLRHIEDRLKCLPLRGYRVEVCRVKRSSLAATKVNVVISSNSGLARQGAKTWKDIEYIVGSSSLSDRLKHRGLNVFRRLFEAEGKAHGAAYNKTHLHELGAADCLVDIFGTLIGLDALNVGRVYSSAINLGSGCTMSEHGRLPVPAPATTELLKGAPVYLSDAPFELTTPTGAALIQELTDNFSDMPLMRLKKTGYGAGQKDIKGFSNVLRILIGKDLSETEDMPEIAVIETNIDDMNPQMYEYIMDMLFKKGAADVFITPVIMKKSRPAVLLTVLCTEDKKQGIIDVLFRETTTIGIRFRRMSRITLDREIKESNTEFGRIRFKTSTINGRNLKFSPEYEDCKRAAREYKIPLREVMRRLARKGKI